MPANNEIISHQGNWQKRALFVLLPVIVAATGLMLTFSIARSAANLSVEIIAGYNLVVDSNVKSPSTMGPSVATVAGKFCNTGNSAMQDVTGYIGNHTANTPGIYPSLTIPVGDPTYPQLAGSGSYAFTHLGGAGDATRIIGNLAPGQCEVQYWSFTYPRCENVGGVPENPPCTNDPVYGAPTNPLDDLKLSFDIWATAKTPDLTAFASHTMTMRDEISAMANKIEPNPDGVWFNTQSNTILPGQVITTNGVNYTFGNVNKGFDNNNDGLFDTNAWMQPFGMSTFDPSCFRLVRTTGALTVTRSGGNPPLVIPIHDQLYFTGLPEDNTNVLGRVYYTFMALSGPCISAMTPYQEAASGADNEKFNADFGTALPAVQSYAPEVVVDKTGDLSVNENANIQYSIPFRNDGNASVGLTLSSGISVDMPFTIQDTVPDKLEFNCTTTPALSLNYTPGTSPGYIVLYSRDSGKTWSDAKSSICGSGNPLSDWSGNKVMLQWRLTEPLPAKSGGSPNTSAGTASYSAHVPSAYISGGGAPFIENTACASLAGAATTMDCGSTVTKVNGTYSIGDLVWRDENRNSLQDAGETGAGGVSLKLYWDKSNYGVIDAGEMVIDTQTTDSNGAYHFTSLPSGHYIVKLVLPTGGTYIGYSSTTPQTWTVDLNSGTSPYTSADFGLGPSLDIDKKLVSSTTAYAGENITYTIDLKNLLPGDGTANSYCQYKVWASIAHPDQSQGQPYGGSNNNAKFTDPNYALNAPNGQYATTLMTNNENLLGLSGFNLAGQTGAIKSIKLLTVAKESANFDPADTFSVQVFRNDTAQPTLLFTYRGDTQLNQPAGTVYNLESTVSSDGSGWSLADFSGDPTDAEVQISAPRGAGDLGIDAVAFVITTDQNCGGSSTTMSTVPLTDTYDASKLQFVSSNPPPSNTPNGTISWSNLGPLYPGATTRVTVNFLAQQPTTQGQVITNTAVVTRALFTDGRLVNGDIDKEPVTLRRGGAISGRLFINSSSGTTTWVNGAGYDLTADTFIPNVDVELFGCANSSGMLTSGLNLTHGCVWNGGVWTLLATKTTDSSGNYSFTGLRDGYYNVAPVAGTLPSTLAISMEADSLADGTSDSSPDGNWWRTDTTDLQYFNSIDNSSTPDNIQNVNFGYQGTTGYINGYVWFDRNANGIWDTASEEPIRNVQVKLCSTSNPYPCNTYITTATTDNTGYYEFAPAAGSYYVVISNLPGGTSQSGDPDGPSANCSSAPGGCDNQKLVSNLVVRQVLGPYNFGYTGGYEIGDTVYADWNGSGSQNTGEEGINDVKVYLYRDPNFNGIVDPGEALLATQTTHTAAGLDGQYKFYGLNGYNYVVVVDETTLPANYVQTGDPNEGSVTCTVCDAKSPIANLTGNSLGNDFGYKPTGFGSIGDTVWYDANANGVKDSSETTIFSGVTVYLYQDQNGDGIINDTTTDALVATQTTNSNGQYTFSNLYPGAYIVKLPDSNFASGQPLNLYGQSNIQTAGRFNQYAVTLAANQVFQDADFGYAQSKMGGTIWSDNDGDGMQGAGELGISGAIVSLERSATGTTGSWSAYSTPQTTDASGNYQFTNLPPVYYYRATVTTPPANYTLTYDPDATPNAGYVNIIYPACNTTNFTGCDAKSSAYLIAGQTDMTHDFGYQPPGAIGDFVWIDSDHDGVQDAGEFGLSGLTVTLKLGAATIGTTTTDNDGYYSFGNLQPNSYTVNISIPAGMYETYDADGSATPGTISFTISGSHVNTMGAPANCISPNCDLALDFGLWYTGTKAISGTVFKDNNTSDGQNYNSGAGDTVLSNVPVYLFNNSNVLIASTTTNSSGVYNFDGLSIAIYRVVANDSNLQLTGYAESYERGNTGGSNPNLNCTVPLSGCDRITTIDFNNVNENGSPVDFGFYLLNPTAVTMGGFQGTAVRHQITLAWDTVTELDAIGFNLYRSTSIDGERVLVNPDLIPSQAPGQIGGASYQYQDNNLVSGTYYYWLEFVDAFGSSYFGPVLVVVADNHVYLPILTR